MNKSSLLWQANIDNQVALWRFMGADTLNLQGELWHTSVSWPNKLWPDTLHNGLGEDMLHLLSDELAPSTVVPVWTGLHQECPETLPGLVKTGELVQMYLELQDYEQSIGTDKVELLHVQDQSSLQQWWQICQQAFGYDIDIEVMRRLMAESAVRILMAVNDGQPQGTALLLTTGRVVGLHQFGVAPAFQGQGLAKQMLLQILALAKTWPVDYMTLQASSAGLGLYTKQGFVQQGKVHSYMLNPG